MHMSETQNSKAEHNLDSKRQMTAISILHSELKITIINCQQKMKEVIQSVLALKKISQPRNIQSPDSLTKSPNQLSFTLDKQKIYNTNHKI